MSNKIDTPPGATHFQPPDYDQYNPSFSFFKIEKHLNEVDEQTIVTELYYWVSHKRIWIRDYCTTIARIIPISEY